MATWTPDFLLVITFAALDDSILLCDLLLLNLMLGMPRQAHM